MNRFTNPFVWLRRFRHRCGYGVHSPFAFRFITEVVYEETPYYAYEELDALLPPMSRMRIRKCLHLLFRLSNYRQPESIVVRDGSELERQYLQAGRSGSLLSEGYPEGNADLIYLSSPDEEVLKHLGINTVLILDNLQQHRDWFRSLPGFVTFDLWDMGFAFFDPQYNKQHYIVNF